MEPQIIIKNVLENVENFYKIHTEIKASHGIRHVLAVHNHSKNAIASHLPPLSDQQSMEIQIASLLHDVDDSKYFPPPPRLQEPQSQQHHDTNDLIHAKEIMHQSQVPIESHNVILSMIQWVSCSSNGNSVPLYIQESNHYHLLIPRWSDRLEAVGPMGVVRCYQYNQERNLPLANCHSPRAKTYEQVWEYATPERFVQYQKSGGSSTDMISHYYDKLLHIALPPSDIVRNVYLEQMQQESAVELLEVCLRFGKFGKVDEEYIMGLAKQLVMDDGD
jgi:uncharacterized protein